MHVSSFGGPAARASRRPALAAAQPVFHPHLDEHGQAVAIENPTVPSPAWTWRDPAASVAFCPNGRTPLQLNGIALGPWAAPQTAYGWNTVDGQNASIEIDHPFAVAAGKEAKAGIVIVEPDGRLWLIEPTNHYGGSHGMLSYSFPQETPRVNEAPQVTAIRGAYEETGLRIRIVRHLGDYGGVADTVSTHERPPGTAYLRYYIAERIAGTPSDMGWESQGVHLVTPDRARQMLHQPRDHAIFTDLLAAMR
jgi:ADP-ribose pyrophosphatase YjhB (NUDIX family)